jgi:drug/metabolite transporter (DMT)-like permease
LLIGGNGGVVLAAKMVPSGLTALLVATAPLWIVLLNWLWLGNARPGAVTWGGVALGIAGIGVLSGSDSAIMGASPVNPFWAGVLTAAAFCWALGSVYSRKAQLPESAVMSTAMQMLTGGVAFLLIGFVAGEFGVLAVESITLKSGMAFLYLVVFGSLVGFSAYVWLLKNTSPVLAATYAYVNPLVAIVLGALLDGETVGLRTIVSAMIILLSVIMITAQNAPRKTARVAGLTEAAATECTKT